MDTFATAQNADLAPLLEGDLRRLSELRTDVPVLSLYIDLNTTDFATQPARDSAYSSLLDEAHKRIEEFETGHDGLMSLRADLERARTFLGESGAKRASGLVIFAASAAGLFEAYTLARAPRSRVVIDDSPYVTPLFAAADLRDWLIVVADARNARFLHGNAEHIEELEHAQEQIGGQHERQGTSDHQRWVENQIDQHLKRVAADVDRRLATGRFGKVLIAGSAEIAPRLEENMSNPAREKLAGRFAVEVPDTIPDHIREAARPCFEEQERRHEREVLDRLAERLGRGERAAGGIADVLAMLEQARVETLVYDTGAQAARPEAIEQAIEDAVAQSAEILPLRHHRDALEPHGHIAAVLRF